MEGGHPRRTAGDALSGWTGGRRGPCRRPGRSPARRAVSGTRGNERERTSRSLARPERFELPTPWFVARYSIRAELRAREGRDYRGSSAGRRVPRRGSPTWFGSSPPRRPAAMGRRPATEAPEACKDPAGWRRRGWDRANTMRQAVHACAGARTGRALSSGGEGGIRTLDGLSTHTPLAGERLQPLGHLSGDCGAYRRASPPAKNTPADRMSPVHRGDCPRRGGADRTCPAAHVRPPGRRSPRHAPRERRRSRRQHGAAEPSPACPARIRS